MKNQLITLLLFILGFTSAGFGQTGFQDGQVTFTIDFGPTLGQSQANLCVGSYYSLDSVDDLSKYFTVNEVWFDVYVFGQNTGAVKQYQIIEMGDSVSFSGTISIWNSSLGRHTNQNYHFVMCDFSLKSGDTLWMPGLLGHYVVDSTRVLKFEDGLQRRAQIIHFPRDQFGNERRDTIVEGVGTLANSLPFFRRVDLLNPGGIVSVCHDNQTIIQNQEFTQYLNLNYCDSSNIRALVNKYAKVSIGEQIVQPVRVSPNPTSNRLTLDGLAGGFEVFDNFGKKVSTGDFNQEIDVSNLVTGQYLIRIVTKYAQYHFRVIKSQ